MAKAKKKEMAEVVTEVELRGIETYRIQCERLKSQLKDVEAALKAAELAVTHKLARGAECIGPLRAVIEQKDGPCRPSWKDEHLEHMESVHGIAPAAVENELRAKYPAKPHERLVIIHKTEVL